MKKRKLQLSRETLLQLLLPRATGGYYSEVPCTKLDCGASDGVPCTTPNCTVVNCD
jgi:hypothetical protein